MDIKDAIIQILQNNFQNNTQVLFPDISDDNELNLSMTVSFIKGLQTRKKEFFLEFIKEMKFLKINNQIYNNDRNAKIHTYQVKKTFKNMKIDFDDVDYIKKLLEYFLIISKEEIELIEMEENYQTYKKTEKKNIYYQKLTNTFQCTKIDGHETEKLFVRRIKPTLSLNDYAEMVMHNFKKKEEKEKNMQYKDIHMTDIDEYEKEIKELQQMDELKDNIVPGKTYKQA